MKYLAISDANSFFGCCENRIRRCIDWYELQQPGLGLRFRNDVRKATLQIARTPMLFPIELDEVRRYIMNLFSYTLRYVLRGDEVWFMAVSHQHRQPDYWVGRTSNQ